MTVRLPAPPAEVPADRDPAKLASLFAELVFTLLRNLRERGFDPIIFEGYRSDERCVFLYGFGRYYDDGRGIVTQAKDGRKTWHRYGLAVDIVSASKGWKAPAEFWDALRVEATLLGLRSGDDWDRDGVRVEDDPDEHVADLPHVQWFIPGMHVTPSDHAWDVLMKHGVEAVWRELRAVQDFPHSETTNA